MFCAPILLHGVQLIGSQGPQSLPFALEFIDLGHKAFLRDVDPWCIHNYIHM